MKYQEWLQLGRPSDTLFFVERSIIPDNRPLNDCIADLCRTLRVVDTYVMSKHEAIPIKPGEALECVDNISVCSTDHRRIFTVRIDDNEVIITGRQYYEVGDDAYDESY